MFWRKSLPEAKIQEVVVRVVREAFKQVDDEISKIKSISDLTAKVRELKEKISELEISKSKREEEFARKEREIEHKVGLHKSQVEQDIVLAKREATVAVREANLQADRDRFEQQMKFVTENFDKQATYLQKIISDLAARLPSLDMTADIGRHPTRRG